MFSTKFGRQVSSKKCLCRKTIDFRITHFDFQISWAPPSRKLWRVVVVIGQQQHVTIMQDGGAREIWKPKRAFLNFFLFQIQTPSFEKNWFEIIFLLERKFPLRAAWGLTLAVELNKEVTVF